MFNRKQKRMRVSWVLAAAALLAAAATGAIAQTDPMSGQMMREQEIAEMPMKLPLAPTPFYRERTFLVLLGAGIGGVGIFAYRVGRFRWPQRHTPGGFTTEAVLVVDLVGSTHLATHYGEGLALRATAILHKRALALAEARGLTFVKSTGDGCLMTFPSVLDACQTAIALLRDLVDRPPNLFPAPGFALRAGISYGEILVDGGNDRHASAINKAFRLQGLKREHFTRVEGESSNVNEIPERNRIFLDEDSAQELLTQGDAEAPLRLLGFAKLKGFSGLHRVYEVLWSSEVGHDHCLSVITAPEGNENGA
ncbi:MAG TPA: adenylate/guanylate cyclase domain-containing protein [Methylomirabilota bacterium]|nr:adenylate/guanylate cyclase domain-containing protein [Methylomirabilota bacterium]